MQTRAAHSIYIHCACHRLQLARMQAANSVSEVKMMFGTMGNIWKLFFYSPKKADSLNEVQSVLKLPELKILKPSDTRWLSHERCVRAIYRELPVHYSSCMRRQVMLKRTVSALSLPLTLEWLVQCSCQKFWIFSQE